jgi:tRNA(Ile)-lysidine synthase
VARAEVTDLRPRFAAALDELALEPGRALVAVSGGADSLALLDLLAAAGPNRGLELTVAHFDHGIAVASGEVAELVARAAGRYGLAVVVGRTRLGPDATETRARRARLGWFRQLAASHDASYVFTAHHADDLVETIVMRFLAGSGPAGLIGIPARRGRYVRPLLAFHRAELAGHVAEIGLEPWVDPANADPRHLRTWIRDRILPELESRVPRLRKNLRSARRVFEENRAGWEHLTNELPGLDFRQELDGVSVAVACFAGYSSALVRSVLRALGRRAGLNLGWRQVDRSQALVAKGDTGHSVDLAGGAFAELAFGRLRLSRGLAHPWDGVTLEGPSGFREVGRWLIEWGPDTAPERLERGGSVTWLATGSGVTARPWRPGDRIRPLRGRGERLVVRCMQDKVVPRSRRPSWPVFEQAGQVVWVPGVCRGEGSIPNPHAPATRIEVRAR